MVENDLSKAGIFDWLLIGVADCAYSNLHTWFADFHFHSLIRYQKQILVHSCWYQHVFQLGRGSL